MTNPGVDYSDRPPGGKALAAAGIRFAARYLSHNESKNLSADEANDLAAHGVSCVVVWETTASRAGAGRAAGVADAKEAAAQAAECGMPSGRPVFFAVDWDASPSVVVPYFEGVASVLGLARTGVYGGYRVVDYLLDHKLATWAWQTVAWSGGRWDPRAHIRQYASTIRIGGVVCDHDTAMTADYGQWMPGRTPNITPQQEDDMPLNADDKKWLTEQIRAEVRGLLTADVIPAPTADKANPTWSMNTYLRLLYTRAQESAARQGAQAGVLAALAKGGGLTAEQAAAAAETGARAALAELADALKD